MSSQGKYAILILESICYHISMRSIYIVTLIVTILFAGGYFYQSASAICAIPLEYRIGVLDDRFDLSFDEARLAITDAEAAWEDATERNLFTYSETADFSINFIFDERQIFIDAEGAFLDRLDNAEELSETVQEKYNRLVAAYEAAVAAYETDVASYEKELSQYNATVASYNEEGGAPPEVFDELEAEKSTLDRKQRALNSQIESLNDQVAEINAMGNQGNQLIETYNRGVETFNDTFGSGREFTQGDYVGDAINIYTFKDAEELRLVLVHELGHALSIDHVESESATMHFLLGAQSGYAPTAADLEAFGAICGLSTGAKMRLQLITALQELISRLQ